MKIKEVGFIDKGTGKHQSNIVYAAGGIAPTLTASLGVKTSIMIIDLVDVKVENRDEQNNTIGKSV